MRPANAEGCAASGLVVAAHRRHYLVELDDGRLVTCMLKGRATTLACGDRVDVAQHTAGSVIVALAPRRSLFYRSDAFREKLVAANVTQVIGVVAPDVPVDEHLLNRWIVAAEIERCRFLLVVNKADLPDVDRFAARFAPYAALGYPVLRLSAKHDATPLLPSLRGEHTVIVGQSGMGKSTLINALVPSAAARTGELSAALRSGRHTTTAATLYRLPVDEGWMVDSPGMKVFGLAHCTPQAITDAFADLRELAAACRFRNCRHEREPGCAVNAAAADGRVAPQRVALLQALLRESRNA